MKMRRASRQDHRRFTLFSVDEVMNTLPATAIALEDIPCDEASEYLVVRLPRNSVLPELLIAVESAVATLAGLKARTAPALPDSAADHTAFAARNIARREQLRQTLFSGGEWLTAREISGLRRGNAVTRNPAAQANRWKKAGKIFAITEAGRDYFPAWALDAGGEPLPVMKTLLERFADTKSPWTLAFWFQAPNSWLDDKRPCDLLASRPAAVLKAAEAETEGAING
ncbi:hypothetical protein [Pantoea eucrina]|uniref:hypothetical protein n=1 Tax=Pantoea eucrina TaxID=472693 RepID=UPI00080F426A|nr:hypothetical protein [Pantoea eucrina]